MYSANHDIVGQGSVGQGSVESTVTNKLILQESVPMNMPLKIE